MRIEIEGQDSWDEDVCKVKLVRGADGDVYWQATIGGRVTHLGKLRTGRRVEYYGGNATRAGLSPAYVEP